MKPRLICLESADVLLHRDLRRRGRNERIATVLLLLVLAGVVAWLWGVLS